MANRRMFSRAITGSGRFLRLSSQARALYYDLGMEADDDGFAEAYIRLIATGSEKEHLLELESKGFITILDREDLVIHINGWQENNLIRRDRYTPSRYLAAYPQFQAVQSEEKNEPAPPMPQPEEVRAESRTEEPEKSEKPQETTGEPEAAILGDSRLTQVRLGKDRIDQDRLAQNRSNQDRLTGERARGEEAGFPENGDSGDLEMEFCKKRKEAMNLLMNSKYFTNCRASPM